MRPPVSDGIEELHSAGHFDQLAQDSELARAGRIEELDFLESGPHDREPPVMNRKVPSGWQMKWSLLKGSIELGRRFGVP